MNNSTNSSSSADVTFFLTTQLASAICLMILSPVTIISNVLLLLTIFKDPLKCFRTPPTCIIVALALVDFVTGVLIEPLFIMYHLVRYMTWSVELSEPYNSLRQIGVIFSQVGLNSSFFLVLCLISLQFIAITYPHQYRSTVTTRRVLACVVISCVYFTGFCLLQFVGVPLQTLIQVDLHLHSSLITVLLIVGSFMLLRSYCKFAKTFRQLQAQNSETRDAREHANHTRAHRIRVRPTERQFTIVTLLLSGILLACSLPHTVLLHVSFYMKQEISLEMFAGMTIADNMMFLKVALDAFIYSWRLTKYRKSLKIVLACRANH